MNTIPSGFSSVMPILPETALLAEHVSTSGPVVEIMPVPRDSFNGDGTSTEMQNNPYVLDLNLKGHGEELGGGRAAGRAAPPPGNAPAEDDAAARLGQAYTLSLGDGGEAPVPPELARELTRARSYEQLGRAVRPMVRQSQDTVSPEQSPVPQVQEEASAFVADRMRGLVTQAAERGIAAEWGVPEQSAAAVVTPEVQVPETAARPVRQTAVTLTPSDFEAILSMEPELQEALLGMLGGEDIVLGRARSEESAIPVPQGRPGGGTAPSPQGMAEGSVAPSPQGMAEGSTATAPQGMAEGSTATAPQGMAEGSTTTAPPGKPEGSIAPAPPGRPEGRVIPAPPGTAEGDIIPAAPRPEGTSVRPEAMAWATAPATGSAEGGMANLRRITELPYALYLFGSLDTAKRAQPEEGGEPAPVERAYARRGRSADLLRLSEAVRMAAVLHSIYRGGSGKFPQETPWYAPYVQYAVMNGIVRSGEFGDWDEPATRAQLAYIFSGSVPKAEFAVLNYSPRLMDVDEDAGYGAHIYLLCRAGVLGAGGLFHPDGTVTRTEAADIIGRIATPSDRKIY